MKSVGHLNGTGRSSTRSFGIQALAVAGNHCHFGMLLQSGTEGFRRPYRQQVYDLMILQIDQNRSKTLPLFPGPVINPHYLKVLPLHGFMHSLLHVAEHGMAADRYTKPTQQSLARPTSQ
jgi:hypothetical protein